MKKCASCGKEVKKTEIICEYCGFDFELARRQSRNIKEPKEPINYQSKSDLFDYPILSFLLGIAALIIPIYLFSILAIRMSKKPAKPSLEPLSNMGRFLGYLGFIVSTIFILFLLYYFIF